MVLGEPFNRRTPLALLSPRKRFGKTAIQPGVSEGLARREAGSGVPVQTLLYEVSKGGVLAAFERDAPILAGRRTSQLAAA